MSRVAFRLEEWRAAEHRRNGLQPGSPAWQIADDDVRSAQTAYRGEVAQAGALHAELDAADHDRTPERWTAWSDPKRAVNR